MRVLLQKRKEERKKSKRARHMKPAVKAKARGKIQGFLA